MERREHLAKITAMKNKIDDIQEQAQREGRGLFQFERDLVSELEEEIHKIKRTMPGEPLTREFRGASRQSSSGPFKTLGEQAMAVYRAGLPGQEPDPRLYQVRSISGLGETVPSDGGFLVQQDFNTQLLNDAMAQAILAPRCRKARIGANFNGVKLPGVDETSRATGSRAGGVRGYWISEGSLATSSKPKFRKIELELKKCCVLVYGTDELLNDAVALDDYLGAVCPAELAFMLDDSIINGTGAGQPLGFLNSGSLVTVSAETGQKAATIVAENVVKMEARMLGTGQSACWLANKNIKPQLYTMSIAVGTGGVPVFMPAGGLSGQPYPTLFGRELIFIEQCASLGTVGDLCFVDLANGYILAEKGGVESAMSIHLRFDYDESIFRFILRADGQPVRSTPLIPYKGTSDTQQSHFVALATRA